MATIQKLLSQQILHHIFSISSLKIAPMIKKMMLYSGQNYTICQSKVSYVHNVSCIVVNCNDHVALVNVHSNDGHDFWSFLAYSMTFCGIIDVNE